METNLNYDKWSKGEYKHTWPQSLLDLVENEELSIDQANKLMIYCEENNMKYPGDHDEWMHLYSTMYNKVRIY